MLKGIIGGEMGSVLVLVMLLVDVLVLLLLFVLIIFIVILIVIITEEHLLNVVVHLLIISTELELTVAHYAQWIYA